MTECEIIVSAGWEVIQACYSTPTQYYTMAQGTGRSGLYLGFDFSTQQVGSFLFSKSLMGILNILVVR